MGRQEAAPQTLAVLPQQWCLADRRAGETLPGPQQDGVALTSLLVLRTEGWDPGGRILRGAPTERLCP